MTLLKDLSTGVGHLKAGFLGFNKSGKTFTATELAIHVREMFDLDGSIAFFDTEGGAAYVRHKVLEATGKPMVGIKSRSLHDLIAVTHECVKDGVSVLIADSMTHVWREVCETFLTRLNAARARSRKDPLVRLEFQHWSQVKAEWAVWSDLFLNAPLHIIICGRAGYEWDFEEDEDTGRKQLLKTGIKMKTEAEFGFEPSLLVQMERVQAMEGDSAKAFVHRATVLGDRFGVLDAATCDDPTPAFFQLHLDMLTPGDTNVIDTERKSDLDPNAEGNSAWRREKKARTILCEEIKHELLKAWPGMTKDEKLAKAKSIEAVFETGSWEAVEGMESDRLRIGLEQMKRYIRTYYKDAPK